MGRLGGKFAIVTGASRGIGRAIALELAREGAKVALNYQSNEALAEKVAEEIRAGGGECMLARANVADSGEARGLIKMVVDAWGRLDILVNNAGITRDKSLRKMTDDDWLSVIGTNLNAVFFCTTAAMQPMLAQKYGRIINISSMNGQIAAFGQANYAASKGGIIAFTKTAALELAKSGITVNVIAPGFTLTDMLSQVPSTRALARVASNAVTGPLVEARALTKRFDAFVAVDGVDFAIEPGEAFGFLGPNGAGKTSTMRMIGCVSPRSGGELRVLGLDPAHDGARIRGRLGVVPQEDNLDTELTVWDNMMIYGRYFDLPRAVIRERAAELLDFVQLADRRDSRVDPLSGGMKRRLTIARALINEPDLVLLDEPTTGLDPQARHMLWDRLYQLRQNGVTLVLTTHYMDEAEQLCDRLVVMDEARIVAEGSPRELIAKHVTREVVEVRFDRSANPAAALPKLRSLAKRVEPLADRVLVYTDHGDATVEAITNDGIAAASVLVRRASLEDVFLILTGRTLED